MYKIKLLLLMSFLACFSLSVFGEKNDETPLILTPEAMMDGLLPQTTQSVKESKLEKKNCDCQESKGRPANGTLPSPKSSSLMEKRFDWIRLTSEEWLKGDLLSMYDEELEFDSDELNLLTLDWDDVAEIYSKGMQSVRLIDGSIMEGWLEMKDGVLEVTANGETVEIDSLSVMTIASSASNRRDLWDGDISLGININKGNSETIDYTLTTAIQRRTASSRLKASYIANFSENTAKDTDIKVVTADSKRFTTQYDFFYTDNIFIRATDFEYFSDAFQNVDERFTYSVAIGYPFIKEKGFHWDVTAGPGYQATNFSNVSVNESNNEKSTVLNLSSDFEYEINKQVEIVSKYQLQLVNEQSGKALHQFQFALELDLIDDFDIDLTYYLNRTAKPREDELGISPEKNDYRFVVSLKYKF